MDLTRKKSITDDLFVWVTSMGLAIGVAMIVCLLYLVVSNGFQVFWPREVAVLQLRDAQSGIRGSTVVGGEITKRQEKLASRHHGKSERELQLFVGNREVYGFTFKYLDEAAVETVEYPGNILSVERMEYGNAIGFPQALVLSGGKSVPSEHLSFDRALRGEVAAAKARRERIRDLEKVRIGAVNRRMESMRLEEARWAKSGQPVPEPFLERKADLQRQYEALAREAQALRAQQKENELILRLADGAEMKIKTGQILSFVYPNRLNIAEKIGLAIRRIGAFLAEEPREANTEGGVFPAIFGTFVMTLLMSLAVMPFGVLAAIYLREYARQGMFVRAVRIAVNNLAGVPSIVFGVFGLGFFVYFVGGTLDAIFFSEKLPTPTFGTGGILWAALTLALMTVPVVIVATEEALAAVSRGVREGSLACGASKWQTIRHVVLPAAAPGILTGLILAMARGAGEVAPLMLVGVVKLAPALPIDGILPFVHLDRKFMHLGFHIYDLGFQSPDSEAAKPMVFATTFLLIVLVVVLNLGAIVIRERLRKKYALGAF